ncbi:MAG TPA: 30S ribosomal protein S4 [Phycisphaerae bacterium]|nr:30S ribosomal protein S4 [Phycisphaerae bacterium]
MARYIGPACRLCRREGVKLMLKGVRCETAKCPMERQWRNMPPGMHAWRRRKPSDYGLRLREKQKVKRYYGVFESQFLVYFTMAERARGNTGDVLLSVLERRLDNVVWKLGFAPSHKSARQVVVHGHIQINGRRANRPGRLVRQGDKVSVRSSAKSQKTVRAALGEGGGPPVQDWLELDAERLAGTVKALPTAEDVQIPVETQLIIEACSR